MKKFFVSTVALVSIVACQTGAASDVVQDIKDSVTEGAKQVSADRDMMGTFTQRDCSVAKGITEGFLSAVKSWGAGKGALLPAGTKVSFDLAPSRITKVQTFYADTNCQEKLYTVRFAGNSKIDTDASKMDDNGTRQLDVEFTKATLIAEGKGVQSFNDNNRCERHNWEEGKEFDVTEHSADKSCLDTVLPISQANVILVKDKSELSLGINEVRSVSTDLRPTQTSSTIYYKQ